MKMSERLKGLLKERLEKEKERIKQKEDLKEINGGKKKWEDKGV
jgi:hypothetical protein